MKENATNSSSTLFAELGLGPKITTVLEKLKITEPTPIQARSIPIINEGLDMIGIAQTGTGKTLAFVAPIIQRLQTLTGDALILVPTRELALQVDNTIRPIIETLNPKFSSAVLIGGANMLMQIRRLKSKPRIVVATPGRLQDHINRRTYQLSKTQVVVLDEADRMFDMGFAPQVKKFLEAIPESRQTLLFSATMSKQVVALTKSFLKNPKQIEVTPPGSSVKNITQEVSYQSGDKKFATLRKILSETKGKTIVFTKTKRGAEALAEKLHKNELSAVEIHSDRSLSQRTRAIEGFKSGKYKTLVATDVAARGIHIESVETVVNYDLPMNTDDYTHRIGRTGRAGKAGRAISFAQVSDAVVIRNIQRELKLTLSISSYSSEVPGPRESNNKPERNGRPSGRGGGGGGRNNRFKKPGNRQGPAGKPSGKPRGFRNRSR